MQQLYRLLVRCAPTVSFGTTTRLLTSLSINACTCTQLKNLDACNAIFERYGFANGSAFRDAGDAFLAIRQIAVETSSRRLRRLIERLARLPDSARVSHVRKLLSDEERLTVEADFRCVRSSKRLTIKCQKLQIFALK